MPKKKDNKKKKGLKSSSGSGVSKKSADGAITVKSGSIKIIQSSTLVTTSSSQKSLGEHLQQLKHSHIPSVVSGVLREIETCITESENDQNQSYHKVMNESLSLIMDNNEQVRKAASSVVSAVIRKTDRLDGDRVVAYIIACLTHLKHEIRQIGMNVVQNLIEYHPSVLYGYKSKLLPIMLQLCLKQSQSVSANKNTSLEMLSTANSSSSATANPKKRTKEMNAKTDEILETLNLLVSLCSVLMAPRSANERDEKRSCVNLSFEWNRANERSPLSLQSSLFFGSNSLSSLSITKRLFQSLDMQKPTSTASTPNERISIKLTDTISTRSANITEDLYSESQTLHDMIKMLISIWIESCEPLFTLPKIYASSLFNICYSVLTLLQIFSNYARSRDSSFQQEVFGSGGLQAVWEKQFSPWFPFGQSIQCTDTTLKLKITEMNIVYCHLTVLHFPTIGNQKQRIFKFLQDLFTAEMNMAFSANQIEQIRFVLEALIPHLSTDEQMISGFLEVLIDHQIDCNSREVAKGLFSMITKLVQSHLFKTNDTLLDWISTLSEQAIILGNKDIEFSKAILSFLIDLAKGSVRLDELSSPEDIASLINVSCFIDSEFRRLDPKIQDQIMILLHYLPIHWDDSIVQNLLDICHDTKTSSDWIVGLVDGMILRQENVSTKLDPSLISSFILSCILGQRYKSLESFSKMDTIPSSENNTTNRLLKLAREFSSGSSRIYVQWSQNRIYDILKLGRLPGSVKSVLAFVAQHFDMPLSENEKSALFVSSF